MFKVQPTLTCINAGTEHLQLSQVVVFLPTFGANTPLELVQLALCGGANNTKKLLSRVHEI